MIAADFHIKAYCHAAFDTGRDQGIHELTLYALMGTTADITHGRIDVTRISGTRPGCCARNSHVGCRSQSPYYIHASLARRLAAKGFFRYG